MDAKTELERRLVGLAPGMEAEAKTQIALQIIERACRLAQGKAPSWRTADPFHA